MSGIKISGPIILHGEVDVQGSKNAALPVLAAAILIQGVSIVHNCPKITDIEFMINILKHIGCRVQWEKTSLVIDAKEIRQTDLPGEYVRAMRCSIIFLGAMLARCGEITLGYPGGCTIGSRPIDLHIKALKDLGAILEEKEDGIRAYVHRMQGNTVQMDFPSVGATQNAILGAVTACGNTVIQGGAFEPEVTELVRFLNQAGAKIRVRENGTYEIEGVKSLHEVEFTIVSDRIVAGTYLLAGMATRGKVILHHSPINQMESVLRLLTLMGGSIRQYQDVVVLDGKHGRKPVPYVETAVYPGFPTDLQSPLMTVLSLAEGVSCIRERIFENRFGAALQLGRMGADIQIDRDMAVICGTSKLHGAEVSAGDLRGDAALVIAGLCAHGETIVKDCRFIDRGYEDICRDLTLLGGRLEKTTGEMP